MLSNTKKNCVHTQIRFVNKSVEIDTEMETSLTGIQAHVTPTSAVEVVSKTPSIYFTAPVTNNAANGSTNESAVEQLKIRGAFAFSPFTRPDPLAVADANDNVETTPVLRAKETVPKTLFATDKDGQCVR
jgi:hypothetical protein